jgi:hypothetical protein
MKTSLPVFVLALVIALTGATIPSARNQAPQPGQWRAIEGTWSATGQRRTLPIDAERVASTSHLSGVVVLTATAGTSRGFQGEAVTFDDGAGVSVGRAVWTDERGDRIFSRLNGDAMRAGRRVVGTITGGTGRYAGLEGDYVFDWQYVVQGEEGVVQGHTVGLKGRVRATGNGR